MMDLRFTGGAASAVLGRAELDQMPDTPTRRSQHRRAHSETLLRFPDLDDLLLDVADDLSLDLPPTPPALFPGGPPPVGRTARPDDPFGTQSQDAVFFEAEVSPASRHRHSYSVDGFSSATSFEGDAFGKQAMATDRLAELALIDPKKVKRILANRQSAARSKERKLRYTGELERKVQTLQAEATKLTAQITSLQRDTGGLTAENKELKLKLQALEQHAHLRDALNEALRNEVQRLKIAAGEVPCANADNRGSPSMASPQNPPLHYFENHNHRQHPRQSPPHNSRVGGL